MSYMRISIWWDANVLANPRIYNNKDFVQALMNSNGIIQRMPISDQTKVFGTAVKMKKRQPCNAHLIDLHNDNKRIAGSQQPTTQMSMGGSRYQQRPCRA